MLRTSCADRMRSTLEVMNGTTTASKREQMLLVHRRSIVLMDLRTSCLNFRFRLNFFWPLSCVVLCCGVVDDWIGNVCFSG